MAESHWVWITLFDLGEFLTRVHDISPGLGTLQTTEDDFVLAYSVTIGFWKDEYAVPFTKRVASDTSTTGEQSINSWIQDTLHLIQSNHQSRVLHWHQSHLPRHTVSHQKPRRRGMRHRLLYEDCHELRGSLWDYTSTGTCTTNIKICSQ